ncbi:hypothetical protein [Lewinella sp. IMCC34191]|uniref:hypothetical protein n=1 Tax=Lewinella sp. IMCC34191 TaxID=2259172 RepID=UPI000E251D50|nr:hypothetical protein [Lewinella sp. IMCC34191]
MKQENHPIDKLIRQRIASLPPPPTRGWSDLEARLDEVADHTAIAAKLDSLAPVAPAGSWDAFAQKLDAVATDQGDQLDVTVASGLLQAEPTTVSGWSRLAARLEVIGRRREMVTCLKITEATLLLSLLLLFAQSDDWSSIRTQPGKMDASVEPLASLLQPIERSAGSGVQPPDASTDVPQSKVQPTRPVSITAEAVPSLVPHAPGPVVSQNQAVPNPTLVSTVEALPSSVTPLNNEQARILPALDLSGFLGGEPVQYYLSGFVSPLDINDIRTLENKVLGIEAQRKLSTGYSLGLLFEAQQGDNALQFGLVYGHRSYVPAKILLIEEDTSGVEQEHPIRYSRLAYETVSIPLNYQRQLSSNDKWRISAGLGMAMNIVLKSQVNLPADVTLADLNRIIKNSAPLAKIGRENSGASEILDPTQGYLQGGGLLENSSLYVSGNVRIERILNDRWSLYFSPTVGRLLTIREGDGGRGPLEDRIHNTMIQLGTRVRLSDK